MEAFLMVVGGAFLMIVGILALVAFLSWAGAAYDEQGEKVEVDASLLDSVDSKAAMLVVQAGEFEKQLKAIAEKVRDLGVQIEGFRGESDVVLCELDSVQKQLTGISDSLVDIACINSRQESECCLMRGVGCSGDKQQSACGGCHESADQMCSLRESKDKAKRAEDEIKSLVEGLQKEGWKLTEHNDTKGFTLVYCSEPSWSIYELGRYLKERSGS